jgi:hypothetical protein
MDSNDTVDRRRRQPHHPSPGKRREMGSRKGETDEEREEQEGKENGESTYVDRTLELRRDHLNMKESMSL